MQIIKPEPRKSVKLSAIIYALSGVGKTHLCGTAEECEITAPTLIIDVAGGSSTLAGQNVSLIRPKSFKEIESVYKFLLYKNKKYKSVMVDSLTEVQRMISLPDVMGDSDSIDMSDSQPPDRQDWLRSSIQMRRFIRLMVGLTEAIPAALKDARGDSVHVFFTALEKKDEERSLICPQLPGILGTDCGAMVDMVANLELCEKISETTNKTQFYRRLWTLPHHNQDGMRCIAKNRGGRLGRFMDNPSIKTIMSKYQGEDADVS